jgi:hypothetical protein
LIGTIDFNNKKALRGVKSAFRWETKVCLLSRVGLFDFLANKTSERWKYDLFKKIRVRNARDVDVGKSRARTLYAARASS